jgi:adenylate cyclase
MPEIERKFRLVSPPDLDRFDAGCLIRQAYVLRDATELRVRQKGPHCTLTVKTSGGLVREEWEATVPEWVFQVLWEEAQPHAIEKTRYSIVEGTQLLELDIYHGALAGLVTLECEFESVQSAQAFALPAWARDAVDVTDDPSYKNKNLALRSAGNPAG